MGNEELRTIMDSEELRTILDAIDERVYEFIETGAGLDEIWDAIAHRNDRRAQATAAYVDSAFATEETEKEEPEEVEAEPTRAGRG